MSACLATATRADIGAERWASCSFSHSNDPFLATHNVLHRHMESAKPLPHFYVDMLIRLASNLVPAAVGLGRSAIEHHHPLT